MTLDKTPYLDPEIEAERQDKIRKLNVQLRVDKVQIGLFYRTSTGANHSFSIEWEGSFIENSTGWLSWEYEYKRIRVQIGDSMTEQTGSSVVVKFSNIRKLGVNYDFGNPCKQKTVTGRDLVNWLICVRLVLCFDLVTPPVLEEEDFHRRLTGNESQDSRQFRRRVGFLHPGHERVAPYAHHLRVILYQSKDLDNFMKLCEIAGLRQPVRVQIDAFKHDFCSPNRLYMIREWLKALEWRVAFQVEAILLSSKYY